MSQQPSGWYDDPSNPEMLRYWDGVTWTNHTAPKKSPTASQSTIGLPQQQAPGQQGQPGQQVPTAPMPQGSGWQTPGQQGQYPQQGQGHPGYQQAPQYPSAPGGQSWMHNLAMTADGVPLASWGRRFGAWLIDGLVVGIIGGTIAWVLTPRMGEGFRRIMDAAAAGDQASVNAIANELTGASVQFSLILWLFTTAYCLFFWTRTGQTPGKAAVGISVRAVAAPGPLELRTAVMRRLVPLAAQFVPFLSLLDGLWPLWDDKRQAIHDKVASTQVVMGKQPRRQG